MAWSKSKVMIISEQISVDNINNFFFLNDFGAHWC